MLNPEQHRKPYQQGSVDNSVDNIDNATNNPPRRRGRPPRLDSPMDNSKAEIRRGQLRSAQRKYRDSKKAQLLQYKEEANSAKKERDILIMKALGEERAKNFFVQEHEFKSGKVLDIVDFNKTRTELGFEQLLAPPSKQHREDSEDIEDNQFEDRVNDEIEDPSSRQPISTLESPFYQDSSNSYLGRHGTLIQQHPYPSQAHGSQASDTAPLDDGYGYPILLSQQDDWYPAAQ